MLAHIDDNGNKLCAEATCPAYNAIRSGETIEAKRIYLHHKDGQRIAVFVRASAIFNQSGQVDGAVEIFRPIKTQTEIEAEIEDLKKLSMMDTLTGVGNRRFGKVKIDSFLNQFQRYNWPFGVIFFDVDHFKAINDTYGHERGDSVLKMVAKTLASNLRSFDCLIRWGGEEFVAAVVNINAEECCSLAQKLRILVQNSFIETDEGLISVTVSIGLTLCRPDDDIDSLIDRADKLMYESKTNGRNRVSTDLCSKDKAKAVV